MIAERAYSERNEHREFRERSGKKSNRGMPGTENFRQVCSFIVSTTCLKGKGACLGWKSAARYAPLPVPPLA